MGAGGAAGTGDAANLLKPALARGTLRTIAATTWAEYKKHIEKDPALTRRFQVVKVEEPDEAQGHPHDARACRRRSRSITSVQVLDEAIEAAVRLSHRYIAGRQLPDKAVSLIDTAARSRRHQPARRPAGGGRLPPPHRGARDRAGDPRRAKTAIGIDHQARRRRNRRNAGEGRRIRLRRSGKTLERGEGTRRQNPRAARQTAGRQARAATEAASQTKPGGRGEPRTRPHSTDRPRSVDQVARRVKALQEKLTNIPGRESR